MGLKRQQPNIIITGTPGVGKTSHCEMLVQNTGLKHLSINQVVKEQGCHNGWDDNYQSWIVDEEKVSGCLWEDPTVISYLAAKCERHLAIGLHRRQSQGWRIRD